ncbi:MAG: helix-turn-helix domain-containing protein [Phycisphaeraceae bacterium]|nr:helix-turn-helix domain-containing protein [Phycisphaeraceae bacterium]
MQIAGIGRIIFWEGGSVWVGLATAVIPEHAHHAIQLTFALRGGLRFRSVDGSWAAYDAAMIPADLPHSFDAGGSVVGHIFVDPESAFGRGVRQRFGDGAIMSLPAEEAVPLGASILAALERGASDEELVGVAREGMAKLTTGVVSARPSEPRVVRAIEAIRSRLDASMTLGDIARVSHLSPGRFRHLFVAETGVPFKTYVLWLRLDRALSSYAAGGSWTDAAHAANFADSAHLTRTLRRMFGLAPSSLRVRQATR